MTTHRMVNFREIGPTAHSSPMQKKKTMQRANPKLLHELGGVVAKRIQKKKQGSRHGLTTTLAT